MNATLLPLAVLLSTATATATATDAPKPLTSAAAVTVTLEPGPTPMNLPMEKNADGDPKIHPRWALTIDASGHVTALDSIGNPPVPAVRAPLENAIRGWHFQPGTIDGKPAETKTTFSLDLSLVEHGSDQFALRVDDARTGSDLTFEGFHHSTPKYPSDAMNHHRDGMVVLRIDYDGKGHVIATRLQDGAPEVDASFVRSAQEAARRWTFSPEIVGGHGLAGSTIVPICFADYRRRTPQEAPKCAWTPPEGHGSLGDGAVVAIDPAARLETDVVGHTL
jgi:TonB family protein